MATEAVLSPTERRTSAAIHCYPFCISDVFDLTGKHIGEVRLQINRNFARKFQKSYKITHMNDMINGKDLPHTVSCIVVTWLIKPKLLIKLNAC